mmetsp:Transcript_29622/g.95070  ORF Transcript_29622/g.95070 Transcript_29622/m.95070 type:complete len:921 (-) Transcript_29622:3256-6018(-)
MGGVGGVAGRRPDELERVALGAALAALEDLDVPHLQLARVGRRAVDKAGGEDAAPVLGHALRPLDAQVAGEQRDLRSNLEGLPADGLGGGRPVVLVGEGGVEGEHLPAHGGDRPHLGLAVGELRGGDDDLVPHQPVDRAVDGHGRRALGGDGSEVRQARGARLAVEARPADHHEAVVARVDALLHTEVRRARVAAELEHGGVVVRRGRVADAEEPKGVHKDVAGLEGERGLGVIELELPLDLEGADAVGGHVQKHLPPRRDGHVLAGLREPPVRPLGRVAPRAVEVLHGGGLGGRAPIARARIPLDRHDAIRAGVPVEEDRDRAVVGLKVPEVGARLLVRPVPRVGREGEVRAHDLRGLAIAVHLQVVPAGCEVKGHPEALPGLQVPDLQADIVPALYRAVGIVDPRLPRPPGLHRHGPRLLVLVVLGVAPRHVGERGRRVPRDGLLEDRREGPPAPHRQGEAVQVRFGLVAEDRQLDHTEVGARVGVPDITEHGVLPARGVCGAHAGDVQMRPVGSRVGALSQACEGAVEVAEDALVGDAPRDLVIHVDVCSVGVVGLLRAVVAGLRELAVGARGERLVPREVEGGEGVVVQIEPVVLGRDEAVLVVEVRLRGDAPRELRGVPDHDGVCQVGLLPLGGRVLVDAHDLRDLDLRAAVVGRHHALEADPADPGGDDTVAAVVVEGRVAHRVDNRRVGKVVPAVAGDRARRPLVEDAQAVAAVGVRGVAREGQVVHAPRAHLGGGRGPRGERLQVEPEAVAIRARGGIIHDVVVGVGDPERSWGIVRIEERGRGARAHGEVPFDGVVLLDGVLNEEGVPHVVVRHVVEHSEEVHAVDGHRAVVGVVHGAVAHVARGDVAHHVKVEGVPAKVEGLAAAEALEVGDAAHGVLPPALLGGREHHHVRAPLGGRGRFVSLNLHIAR